MSLSLHEEMDEGIHEINMTPLVDVMLVLLVVFIVTIPVVRHAVRLDLPSVSSTPVADASDIVLLSVSAGGEFFMDNDPVSDDDLLAKLRQRASGGPLPGVHIYGDKDARYERLASLLSLLQNAGLSRIGFLTQPVAPTR